MRSGPLETLAVITLSIAGIWFVCAAFTGYALRVMSHGMRVGFGLAGLLLLLPFQAAAPIAWLNAAGAVLGFTLLFFEHRGAHVRA
jgi:hypothetical protein